MIWRRLHQAVDWVLSWRTNRYLAGQEAEASLRADVSARLDQAEAAGAQLAMSPDFMRSFLKYGGTARVVDRTLREQNF